MEKQKVKKVTPFVEKPPKALDDCGKEKTNQSKLMREKIRIEELAR